MRLQLRTTVSLQQRRRMPLSIQLGVDLVVERQAGAIDRRQASWRS